MIKDKLQKVSGGPHLRLTLQLTEIQLKSSTVQVFG